MDEILEIDFSAFWRVPVFVRSGAGVINTIRGPEEALRCLSNRPHHYEGRLQRSARSECIAALRKQSSCDMARGAFVDSCLDDGVLV